MEIRKLSIQKYHGKQRNEPKRLGINIVPNQLTNGWLYPFNCLCGRRITPTLYLYDTAIPDPKLEFELETPTSAKKLIQNDK